MSSAWDTVSETMNHASVGVTHLDDGGRWPFSFVAESSLGAMSADVQRRGPLDYEEETCVRQRSKAGSEIE